jgi:hypothetical protein
LNSSKGIDAIGIVKIPLIRQLVWVHNVFRRKMRQSLNENVLTIYMFLMIGNIIDIIYFPSNKGNYIIIIEDKFYLMR